MTDEELRAAGFVQEHTEGSDGSYQWPENPELPNRPSSKYVRWVGPWVRVDRNGKPRVLADV